jgi:hypothetical protein
LVVALCRTSFIRLLNSSDDFTHKQCPPQHAIHVSKFVDNRRIFNSRPLKGVITPSIMYVT